MPQPPSEIHIGVKEGTKAGGDCGGGGIELLRYSPEPKMLQAHQGLNGWVVNELAGA